MIGGRRVCRILLMVGPFKGQETLILWAEEYEENRRFGQAFRNGWLHGI
jgi:hypothetical protein